MENPAGNPQEFIILTQQILGDTNLSPADKLVLARISGFKQYWESCSACADFLNLSTNQVSMSKVKLEKLGYIQCVENTGHGKTYIFLPNRLQSDFSNTSANPKILESQSKNLGFSIQNFGNNNKYNNKLFYEKLG